VALALRLLHGSLTFILQTGTNQTDLFLLFFIGLCIDYLKEFKDGISPFNTLIHFLHTIEIKPFSLAFLGFLNIFGKVYLDPLG